MMSTENQAEDGVIQSSIALLQERFKQLQRVKEMREKKELLRLFSEYQTNTPTSETFNYESSTSHNTTINNDNDDYDDELQIFLPPNYYYNSRKPSCYSSSSSSSSLLSQNNHNYHNFNEISLSLWPSYNNVTATTASATTTTARCRRASFEVPLSTLNRPSSCVSTAFKFEDCQHVSDVDTTLHL